MWTVLSKKKSIIHMRLANPDSLEKNVSCKMINSLGFPQNRI